MNNSINNAETKQPAIAQAPKLSEPCTESGLLAQETALAAMGWRGFSRQAKRRLRKIIRSCPILAEAIEEYMPDLAGMLCDIESLDKRKGARRSMACILAKIILGFALRAESSRDMDERIFEGEGACALIYELVGEPPQEFLPHWKACLNAIKLSLSPEAISEIKTALAREIMANPAIRRMRKGPFWEVAIDGTQERSYGSKRHCDRCLTKVHSKKNGKQEWTEYYHSVLEAKLIIGGMAISLISVQMRGPDGDGKQECELSALEKMLACLAFYFPGEQFALLMDALYVSRPAIDEIEHYGYKYIIRFKDAAAATIERQFRDRADAERFEPTLPLQKSSSQAPPVCGFANNISFASPSEERAGNRLSMAERQQKRRTVNICEYIERFEDESGNEWHRSFAYITNLTISRGNCMDIIWQGRRRWTIEEAFFIQKCFHGMEHIWSWDRSTNECMYELLQIGHMLIQLVAMELAAAVEAMGLKYVVGAIVDSVRFGSEGFAFGIAEAWEEAVHLLSA